MTISMILGFIERLKLTQTNNFNKVYCGTSKSYNHYKTEIRADENAYNTRFDFVHICCAQEIPSTLVMF